MASSFRTHLDISKIDGSGHNTGQHISAKPGRASLGDNEVATILRWHIAARFRGFRRQYPAAWDFLTVEVLTLRGFVRYHVLIVIDLASCRAEIGGIVHEPTGAWMMQVVGNLLDTEDGFLTGACSSSRTCEECETTARLGIAFQHRVEGW